MTLRNPHNGETLGESVQCTVAPGYCVYDTLAGRQVGPGAVVHVPPALIDMWLKSQWIIERDRDVPGAAEGGSGDGDTELPPVPVTPPQRRRKTAKTVAAD